MLGKETPQSSVADTYKRNQRVTPFLVWGIAVLLVVVGVIILVVWLSGGNSPLQALLASPTPTSTNTFTPTPVTPTSTSTATPTITLTPTTAPTNTPTGPIEYVVQEFDTCWDIAVTFEVDLNVLLALNNFGNDCPIAPGDRILIPLADQELPTDTPIPTDIARGTQIEYTVRTGESLLDIAAKFDSTADAIIAIKANNLTTANDLKAGQKLLIPVRLVTRTPTLAPTNTFTPGGPTLTNTSVPPTVTATP